MSAPGQHRARGIIHIDMDAFFAAVEQRDDPALRGRPVLVGGPSNRGVVAAASYEARRFGIHSAMPMSQALRRCSDAVVVRARHDHYAEISSELFAIFGRYTPLVEGLSLDEAFLDVTDSRRLFGEPVEMARAIKAAVRDELRLTASAGVAHNKFAAKIASDLEKPDGLVVVPEDVARFLAPMPLERMWGLGPVGARRMRDAGFSTIGDLAAAPTARLEKLLGSWGVQVSALAKGLDNRPVQPGVPAKSIGAEETFDHDLHREQDLLRRLLSQSARVAQRLWTKGVAGRVVVVKVKLATFEQRTARVTLPEPICDTDSIFTTVRQLLSRMKLAGRPVRLTGVSVGALETDAVQGNLFADPRKARAENVEAVTARIREKFGQAGLTRASLLEGDEGGSS